MDWQFKIGLGLAIIFGLLPFVVGNMPKLITWPSISVGIAFIIWSFFPKISINQGISVIVCIAAITAAITWYRTEADKTYKEIKSTSNELQDKDFMSLKTVFSKFKEELERESPEDYHSMGSIMERQSQGQENQFVMRFGQSIDVDIYGKLTPISFQDWVKIDKDLFFVCTIKNGLELYRNNILEYNDLAIKRSDLEKAIKESKSSLSDEFISRLYKEIE